MNKKGQVLVLFLIFIPIIALLVFFVVDTALISYEKKNILSVTKQCIIKSIETKQKDDIINIYNSNSVVYDLLDVDFTDGVSINVVVPIKGLYKTYKYNLKLKGYYENNKIVYKKG